MAKPPSRRAGLQKTTCPLLYCRVAREAQMEALQEHRHQDVHPSTWESPLSCRTQKNVHSLNESTSCSADGTTTQTP